MASLKEYRDSIHRVLAADDIEEAFALAGYDAKTTELMVNSKSVRAVRSINTSVAKK